MKVYLGETRVSPHAAHTGAAGKDVETDLLYLLGPLWRVAEGHEYTVGQNRTHDDHAEQRGKKLRKALGFC